MDEYEQTQSSKWRGVTYNKKCKKWQSVINTNGKHVHLGTFTLETDAARVFDKAAIIARGTAAKLNFPISDYSDAQGNLIRDPDVEHKLLASLAAPVVKRPRAQSQPRAPTAGQMAARKKISLLAAASAAALQSGQEGGSNLGVAVPVSYGRNDEGDMDRDDTHSSGSGQPRAASDQGYDSRGQPQDGGSRLPGHAAMQLQAAPAAAGLGPGYGGSALGQHLLEGLDPTFQQQLQLLQPAMNAPQQLLQHQNQHQLLLAQQQAQNEVLLQQQQLMELQLMEEQQAMLQRLQQHQLQLQAQQQQLPQQQQQQQQQQLQLHAQLQAQQPQQPGQLQRMTLHASHSPPIQQQQQQQQQQAFQPQSQELSTDLQQQLLAILPPGCKLLSLLSCKPPATHVLGVVFSTPAGGAGAGLWHDSTLNVVRRFPTQEGAYDHCEVIVEVADTLVRSGWSQQQQQQHQAQQHLQQQPVQVQMMPQQLRMPQDALQAALNPIVERATMDGMDLQHKALTTLLSLNSNKEMSLQRPDSLSGVQERELGLNGVHQPPPAPAPEQPELKPMAQERQQALQYHLMQQPNEGVDGDQAGPSSQAPALPQFLIYNAHGGVGGGAGPGAGQVLLQPRHGTVFEQVQLYTPGDNRFAIPPLPSRPSTAGGGHIISLDLQGGRPKQDVPEGVGLELNTRPSGSVMSARSSHKAGALESCNLSFPLDGSFRLDTSSLHLLQGGALSEVSPSTMLALQQHMGATHGVSSGAPLHAHGMPSFNGISLNGLLLPTPSMSVVNLQGQVLVSGDPLVAGLAPHHAAGGGGGDNSQGDVSSPGAPQLWQPSGTGLGGNMAGSGMPMVVSGITSLMAGAARTDEPTSQITGAGSKPRGKAVLDLLKSVDVRHITREDVLAVTSQAHSTQVRSSQAPDDGAMHGAASNGDARADAGAGAATAHDRTQAEHAEHANVAVS